MIKVKICGITTYKDVNYVNKHLPDFIGFVFANSKRKLSVEKAIDLISKVDKRIKKVGVFVNEDFEKMIDISKKCNLDVVQFHGDEDCAYVNKIKSNLNVEVWKAFRVKDESSLNQIKEYKVDTFLLDTYSNDNYGGTGETFNWNLAVLAKKFGKIVLAGGLNPNNVIDAVNIVYPYAVDVSSGVEGENGKDENKIKKFIYSVRSSTY